MNRTVVAVLSVLTLSACKKAEQTAQTPPPSDSLAVVDSFKTPESVLYDSVMDVYVVSNINGNPADKDGNGFLSRVKPDGTVLELHWVTGGTDSVTLNAPKGMGIKGDTLFVADIDVVRMFDRTTGHSLGQIAVHGASFLNDIDVGEDGTVYVTDTGVKADFSPAGTDAVYHRGANGQFTPMIKNRNLGGPNGVADAGGGGAYVVSFGSGEYYHVTATGERHPLAKPAKGQLDGVVVLPHYRVMASSWADSSIIVLDSGATAWRAMYTGMPSPADIGYDSRRDRVLIPIFQGNRIEVRKVR